jgi:hypothetical protein
MASNVSLELHENNDEIIAVEITSSNEDDDLSLIDTLELYLKIGPAYEDDDPTTLVLTSDDVSEINIVSQNTALIVANAFIPASALNDPYDRFWHLDALTATGFRRTAFYGHVEVISL